jgi:hypothetical protein
MQFYCILEFMNSIDIFGDSELLLSFMDFLL